MANKKVTKDYGLRQHEVTSYQMPATDAEVDAMIAAFKKMKSADQARDQNANLVRGTLANVGIDDAFAPGIAAKCSPEAFHVIGAEWLRNYEWLQICRAKVEAGNASLQDIARLIEIAETLGRLKERIWWRHGVDPLTDTKRENLAVSARESRRALPKGRAALDAHNAEVKAAAAAYRRSLQAKADVIWRRHPEWNNSDVARQIIRNWAKRDAAASPKFNTLRTQIKKPDRA
ncbi:hypothetical protein [Rhizobium sp. Leaf386]|uniref:hypothetical protein n=1 Tax=Rhizobium sp. Leaf386 TaxID=1736359 RepID=UPI000713EAD1|nr:hypothetical protein [Rhizobium sp. Leaf386]KQT04132.1 hypothetical protein ASG50_18205 [Rhizobium sp. Leaf386]